jgi:hypothetical protein
MVAQAWSAESLIRDVSAVCNQVVIKRIIMN